MNGVVKGRVAQSASTEVRVTEVETKGEEFVDIRTFYLDVNGLGPNMVERISTGDPTMYKPTQKGIFIRKAVFAELMETVLLPVYESLKKE